jgi:hypothetical protein
MKNIAHPLQYPQQSIQPFVTPVSSVVKNLMPNREPRMSRHNMKTIATILLMSCLTLSPLAGRMVAQSAPPTTAPAADYSGMYAFQKEGEFLQLTVEDDGRLTGFVSRYADTPDENQTFVEQFFKRAKLEGKNLSFTTGIVQQVSYAFAGTVERGEGKSPGDEAYYVLKGTLTENRTGADKKTSSQSQQVTFKSFPRDLDSNSNSNSN